MAVIIYAVFARVNKAWNKFKELKSFIFVKKLSLNLKGKTYEFRVVYLKLHAGKNNPVTVNLVDSW